jgi:hypothetical protein
MQYQSGIHYFSGSLAEASLQGNDIKQVYFCAKYINLLHRSAHTVKNNAEMTIEMGART